MIRYWLLLALFFTTPRLFAQESFLGPPSKLLTSFPFKQLTGGVMMINGKIDNHSDTLHFILDTGSAGISLDSETVDYLQLPTVPSDKIVKGIGGTRNVKFTNDHTLKLPGLDVEHLNFHINDYEILTSVYGIKIDGVIGYSFLIRYIVEVDFDSSMIYVFSPGEFLYPRGGYIMNIHFQGLPTYPVQVKDAGNNLARFYLDTGAGLNFLVNQGYYDDSAAMDKSRAVFLTQAEGIGGKMKMYLSTVKQIRLGQYRFRRVPTYIFSDDNNVTNYPSVCGLIGNDLLRRFNMVINYQQQEIHLSPNSHFNDPFDYAYTGLSIYYDAGNVTIEDIVPGSPADKAGFLPGDIIYGVDNYVGSNMQAIKDRLQQANTRVKVLIFRNNKLDVITLHVGSIL